MAMPPYLAGDASATRAPPPDASTLGATAFNVGMISADAFKQTQDEKVAQLAHHVASWLADGPAVVGLNEIHPNIAAKLRVQLQQQGIDVGIATDDSNSLWRTPQ